MTLPADFFEAHRRHWGDAEVLYGHERLGNADHLYGFSAECGLKAVMTKLGMPLDRFGGPSEDRHKKHIQHLWAVFERFATARDGSVYLRELPSRTPFSGWSHHDRYSGTGHLGGNAVARHREAARGILRMVELAEQDGTS